LRVVELRSAYATLGVPYGSASDAVRSAYRIQLRLVHPDTGGAGDPYTLGLVRNAYRTIVANAQAQPAVPPPSGRSGPLRRHVDVYA
jgi:hypothetical protein